MPQMCPNCSRDTADNAQVCVYCGEPLRGLLGRHVLLGNRYRLLQVLGCGGMGAVYLADDTRISGRRVAVKENLNTTPQAQAQFQHEVSLMVKLDHPGLPKVSDQFTGPTGRQYLVMDYITGETLEDVVARRGPLPEAEALALARQMLDVLEYLHQHSIIHRDVKPANIKLRPDGKPVLVDFGIAKLHAPGYRTRTAARNIGSPGFAPIEQYGTGTDARSDLYSLGAVMYYLLTGQSPPEAPDLAAGTPLTPPRRLRPDLSPQVQGVVFKAMGLNPAQRYQSAAGMRQALLAPPATTAIVAPPGPRPWRRVAIGVAGAAVVGTTLVVLVWAVLNGVAPGTPVPTSAVIRTPTVHKPAAVTTAVAQATSTATRGPETARLPTMTSTLPVNDAPSPEPVTGPLGQLAMVRRSRDDNLEIFVMDLEDGQEHRVTTTPDNKWSWAPAWSPDGRLIALSSGASGKQEVHTVPTRGGIPTRVINTPDEQRSGQPTWSSDSRSLIFQSDRDGAWQLYRIDLADATTEQLTWGEPPKYIPSWSPTDQEILFAGQVEGIWRIFRFDLETEEIVQLSNGPGHDYAPAWSPDGSWIAFQTDEGRQPDYNEIYIMDRQGAQRRHLTDTPDDKWSRAPTWSPDGRWLAFVSNQAASVGDDFGDIYIVNVSSGEVRRLTFDGGVYDWRVSWTTL
jgi:hypothetical protein